MRVLVGALQREGRRQARRIRERIESGEVGVEAGGAQAVVARQLAVELRRCTDPAGTRRARRCAGGRTGCCRPTDAPARDVDCRVDGPPARGAGITKSPVTGLRRLNRANATSEMQAVSVGLGHCAFGIDRRISGFSGRERREQVLFGARRPGSDWSACGSTVMLLAVGTKPVSACVR